MLGKHVTYAVAAIFLAMLAAQSLARIGAKPDTPQLPLRAAMATPAPIRAALPTRRDEVRISSDAVGQFSTDAEINGARVSKMLVDTGATLVALSYEDASAAGLYPAPADYKYQVNTANGLAHVARVKLADVRIGSIVAHDVEAVVGERGALNGSLLGMTFLSKLSRFSIESGALVLKQ